MSHRARLAGPSGAGAAVALLALSAAGAGCGAAGSGSGAEVTATDSSGVQIVSNAGPRWTGAGGWTVVDSPLVDIGGSDRPEGDLNRVVSAVRTSDGRVVVASALSGEIRFFDSAGTEVLKVGRTGSGPGEFQTISGLWVGPHDSLLVADMPGRPLTLIDPAGAVARTIALGGSTGLSLPSNGRVSLSIPVGWFDDGSVVGMQQQFIVNDKRQGAYRDTMALVRYQPDGATADTVLVAPAVEMEQMPISFGGQTASAPSPVPLGRQTVTHVGGDRVLLARNDAWEIEEWAEDGTLRRLIRLQVTPEPISEPDKAAHREEQVEQMRGIPQLRGLPPALMEQFENRVNTATYPETFPFVAGILSGPDESIWVEEVVKPGGERRRYAVIDSSGAFLGRLEMPVRFRPTFIGADQVTGVWLDPDDIEHVRVYPIRR